MESTVNSVALVDEQAFRVSDHIVVLCVLSGTPRV